MIHISQSNDSVDAFPFLILFLQNLEPEPVDLIEELFTKYQGSDGKVDAFDLQKILNNAKLKGISILGFDYLTVYIIYL